MKKKDLLSFLIELHPHLTKKELFAEILCGKVKVDGETIKDPKRKINVNSNAELGHSKYVSRGGYKLETVLKEWQIEVSNKGFLDAGCSTGGFTDCLLQEGASFVHAVDVGYNQLDYALRVNPKVIVHEKTNIMHLEKLDPLPYGAVADLSFRSIGDAAAKLLNLVSGEFLIALVKPQFEIVNPDQNFNGVISDNNKIYEVCTSVLGKLWEEGSYVQNISLSPIKGRKGNQELLFYIGKKEIKNQSDMLKLLSDLLIAN